MINVCKKKIVSEIILAGIEREYAVANEFPGFCVTQHLAGGRESSYVSLKTLPIFQDFAV